MVFLTKLKPEPMGAHSLSVAYGVNSLVMSDDGAAAYISVKDVPAGTPLTNTDYWKIHTDLTAVKQSAEAAAQRANAARDEMLEIARNLTDTVDKSGNPVQAELVGGLPFDRVETVLSPIQSGSGDPSPSNIRSISGWTGARLTRFVKNLFDKDSAMLNSWYAYSSDNANANPFNGLFASKLIPVQPGEVFTLTNYLTDAGVALVKYLVSETNTGGIESIRSGNAITCDGTKQVYTFTVPDKVRYIGITGDIANIDKVQLELGSAATEYEPYQGNTYSADFGQTVYGGTLDWQTGVLTLDNAMVTLDGTNQKALFMGVNADAIQARLGDHLPDAINRAGNGCLICSHLIEQYGIYSDFPYPHVFLDVSGTPFIRAYFPITIAKTENELNAYLVSQYAAGTPVQVCYKLATPQTIQLTPQEIKQLQGMNTLYGDGSISMTGRADKALALDARIAALEAAG